MTSMTSMDRHGRMGPGDPPADGHLEPRLPPRPPPDRPAADRITAWLAWFGLGRLIITALCVAVVSFGAFWLVRAPAPPAEATLPSAAPTSSPAITLAPPTADGAVGAESGSAEVAEVVDVAEVAVVHVAGAVNAPGVYHLTGSRRVHEAIELAGGAAADADLDAVNLAQSLVDGQRLYVPTVGEAAEGIDVVTPAVPAAAGVDGDGNAGVRSGPVDLNRATQAELDTLPGVGPSTAQAIIDDRERNGPFATVDELDRVPGIGPAKLASLRDLVTV